VTPYFRGFPGSISLRLQTYLKVIEDILGCLFEQGFRNIVIVNGHGGNMPAATLSQEWMIDHPGTQVKFHNWYNAPKTWKKVQEIDPVASHASWMENFPWTRLEGVTQPSQQKQMVKFSREGGDNAQDMRRKLGDGNFGGYYERPDSELMALWDVAVHETREIIETGWK
jgi:creatinine amidohydrolase